MNKVVLAISLAAIMLLCGCGAGSGSIIITSVPQATDTPPSASTGIVIPCETKVYVAEGELAAVKPLFESYLSGNDMLEFAVSAVFKGEVYLMGFVYANNEGELPFSRVIGLKQNGTGIEKAFISDKYDNPEGWIPENWKQVYGETFYDTQAFEYRGMTVVLTTELLNEYDTMKNVFVINEKGILCNNICVNAQTFIYQDKLFFYKDYTWSEFSVQNDEVVLNEVTDYAPYKPQIKDGDIVIELKSCIPGEYDEKTMTISDNNYIELYIDGSKKLIKEDFNMEEGFDDWGPNKDYYSKTEFNVDKGSNIIILYHLGTQAGCFIYDKVPYAYDDFEYYRIPGVSVFKASEAGEYIAAIAAGHECYNIRITAE